MPNVKLLGTTKIVTTVAVYCIVRREADNYRLDDADGAFTASPADPYISCTEDSIIKGLYEKSESRTAWAAGRYKAFFYKQVGGSPAPVSDVLSDIMDFYVVGDRICVDFPFEYGKVVSDAGNGAAAFVTDLLSSTGNYCKDSYLKFVSGALINQQKRISAYNGTSKLVTVSSAFTGTPAAGDEFFIVNQ